MNNLEHLGRLLPLSQLRVAVKTSDPFTVRAIITANPELLAYRDETGATALRWAVEWQDFSVVDALIELGADPTIQDNLGYTPAELATWSGEYANGTYTEVSRRIVRRIEEARCGGS